MFVGKWMIRAGVAFVAMSPLGVFAEDSSQTALVDIVLNEKSSGDDIIKAIEGITDKPALKRVLLNATKWESKTGSKYGYENFVEMCKRLDNQDDYLELLHGSMPQLSVYSFGSYEQEGKYAVWALVDMLDGEHLAVLDRERKARRKSVEGKVVNCLGFYPGMPFVDFVVLMRTKYREYSGTDKYHSDASVFAKVEFDHHPVLPMCSLAVRNVMFEPKFFFAECGVGDGLEGLMAFAEKFVPGGSNGYGEPKIDVDNNGWSVIVPKAGTTIVMNTNSKLRMISDKADVRLDFSKSELYMDDPGDDDVSAGGSSGGFMSFVVKLLVLCGIVWSLCLFKGKIDVFVEKNPKYAKVWSVMCKTGAFVKERALKIYDLAKTQIQKKK